ncbi:MAG TPA: type II toxin-antitoxin system RelE/ParE family toxin [Acidiferrobacteraceae bacterium]|nr:type II toxin-antitoxin system RelE/ParE family toxin [Acidiferrobacteraceae bacterium]
MTISTTTSPAASPDDAEQIVDRLIEAVSVLLDHPKGGRRVPEVQDPEGLHRLKLGSTLSVG